MAKFDWSGLMKILEEQEKLNGKILGRLKKVEARLAKIEKKPKKEKP